MESKTVQDIASGAGAISAPMWVTSATAWVELLVMCGGLVLVGIRIWQALRERSNGTD